MADACARRYHTEVLKRRAAPAQELITLAIALIFALHIALEAVLAAEIVDHDRVINHQVNRHLRIDRFSLAAKLLARIAHRSQINNRRNTGKVLHQHTRRTVSNLLGHLAAIIKPRLKRHNIVFGDRFSVFIAQHILQENL